jgi:hypothetical protein
MQARHTQGLAGIGAAQTKTLVNRTRMKVVNIALTKFFEDRAKNSMSSRRTPGPITTGVIGWHGVSAWLMPSASLKRRVWVPAFAGTTGHARVEPTYDDIL